MNIYYFIDIIINFFIYFIINIVNYPGLLQHIIQSY